MDGAQVLLLLGLSKEPNSLSIHYSIYYTCRNGKILVNLVCSLPNIIIIYVNGAFGGQAVYVSSTLIAKLYENTYRSILIIVLARFMYEREHRTLIAIKMCHNDYCKR